MRCGESLPRSDGERLPAEEGAYACHHLVQLRLGELREDRQREHFLRRPFALGALAFAVPEVREAGLEVEWQRIVDGGPDTTLLEERLQRVAPRCANRVLIED